MSTGLVQLELAIEFGVIVAAPLLHAWWRVHTGRATRAQALHSLRIFVPLYLLLGVAGWMAWQSR